MSGPARDYEDLLRRALHSAVDPIEPADDGLERIRARLTTPDPLPVAWVVAAYAEVAGRARGGLQSALEWLKSVPERMMPGPSGPSGQASEVYTISPPAASRRPWFGRARLATVVAAITLIMAMSVSAVTPFGKLVLAQASALYKDITASSAGTGSHGQAPGQLGGGGSGGGLSAGSGAAAAHGTSGHGQPAASCTSSTPALAAPAARPSPAVTTSPASPSPAVSTSPASPSPAVSTSPASPSPGVSTSPASPSPGVSTSPASPSPAVAGRAGPRRALANVTDTSSSACASTTPRPSRTPHPSPSSPPGATLAPSSPPASPSSSSSSPASPSPSTSPAASPSPSTTPEPASTAPASTGPSSSSPPSSSPAASPHSDTSSASGSADTEGS